MLYGLCAFCLCVFPACHVFDFFSLGIFWLCSSIALAHFSLFRSAFSNKHYALCCDLSFFPRSNWPLTFVEKNGKKQDKVMDHRSKDEKGEE